MSAPSPFQSAESADLAGWDNLQSIAPSEGLPELTAAETNVLGEAMQRYRSLIGIGQAPDPNDIERFPHVGNHEMAHGIVDAPVGEAEEVLTQMTGFSSDKVRAYIYWTYVDFIAHSMPPMAQQQALEDAYLFALRGDATVH